MSIDLDSRTPGLNATTVYREEAPATSIVSPWVQVGSGSGVGNSAMLQAIRIVLRTPASGDTWTIGPLPASVVVALAGPAGTLLLPGQALDATVAPVLVLRPRAGASLVTDLDWAAALRAIRYGTAETVDGVRVIDIQGQSFAGLWLPPVQSTIGVQAVNDVPVARDDQGTADEAGGASNSVGGTVGTGNVLANDSDNDAGSRLSVTQVGQGGVQGPAGQVLQGIYGRLVLQADGRYTYAVDQNDARVQALRTPDDTLTDAFVYTVTDNAGARSQARLTMTIRGRNDAPTALDLTALPGEPAPARWGVDENAPAGTPVARARATDPDAGETFTYALLDDARGRFTIDARSGEIRVAPGARLDHETTPALQVVVQATDSAGHSIQRGFTLEVRDADEAPLPQDDRLDVSGGRLVLALDQASRLWWLDLDSGQRALAAGAGVPLQAIARTADGVVYGIGDHALYRVDPATGGCAPVARLGGAGPATITGLTAADNGRLYAVDTLTAVIDLPFVLVYLVAIALMAGHLVWVPLLAMPLMLGIAWALQGPVDRAVRTSMQASAQKHGMLIEAIAGLETVKLTASEGVFQAAWERAVRLIAQASMASRLISTTGLSVVNLLQSLAAVALLIAGVYLVSGHALSMGGLIAASILASRALAPCGQLASLLSRWKQTRIATDTLARIFERPVERPPGTTFLVRDDFTGSVALQGVSFAHPNSPVPALVNVSLAIAAGERVALIGRSGSGKSTLAKLVAGLYQPASGTVLVSGTDVRQLDPHQLRRAIGCVPQDPFLFNGTLRENIGYGAEGLSDEALLQAAREAGVDDFARTHPQGYDMPVGERGAQLSGGQRQAVVLARALAMPRALLLLDEPSSSLDQAAEQCLRQRLARRPAGETLLLVTHRLNLLDLVDRVVVLHQGQVAMDGPREAVLQQLRGMAAGG